MSRVFFLVILPLLLIACGGAARYEAITTENAVGVSRVEVLNDHTGSVNAVVWSPDGMQLASAGDDQTIFIWTYGDLEADPREWSAHSLPITSLAYSSDGEMLASGGRDSAVILWDAANGEQLGSFTHTDQVMALAFSPDGSLLASTGRDGTVILFDPANLEVVRTIDGFDDRVNDLAFSPDGTKLATAGNDNKVQVWDVASGSMLLEMTEHVVGATAVAFSPDGATIASGAGDARVRIWDAASGELLRTCSGLIARVTDLGFSATEDSVTLASVSDDKALALWNPENCQRLGPGTTPTEQITTGHGGEINALSWRPDGTVIATASYDQDVLLWAVTRE